MFTNKRDTGLRQKHLSTILDSAARFIAKKQMALAVLAALALIATLPIGVKAQSETGQISGKVTDPQNSTIANAQVLVKSLGNGNQRSANTNGEGFYTVTNLQPGAYEVSAVANGFGPSIRRAEVTVGSKVTVDMQLSVSAVKTESVTIVGGGLVEVNTGSATFHSGDFNATARATKPDTQSIRLCSVVGKRIYGSWRLNRERRRSFSEWSTCRQY